jgi:hypothetical protein
MSFFKETNYNNEQKSTFKPYYKIGLGEKFSFRIAPSCRNLPNGQYAVYHKAHYGYGVQDPQKPDKTYLRPFLCIHKIDYKTKATVTVCPECVKVEQVTQELEALKTKLKDAGEHSAEYIQQVLTPHEGWLSQHNLDKKYYCYAKNTDNVWNVLKLGYKTKVALDVMMQDLFKSDSISALDPANGIWITFSHNGKKGSDASVSVSPTREKADMGGKRVEIIKQAPLTEQDVAAIQALVDITTIYPKISYAQVNALVESGGDPEVAAAVFAQGEKLERSPAPVEKVSAPIQVREPPKQVVVQNDVSDPPWNETPAAPAVQTAPPKDLTPKPMSPDEFLRSWAKKG